MKRILAPAMVFILVAVFAAFVGFVFSAWTPQTTEVLSAAVAERFHTLPKLEYDVRQGGYALQLDCTNCRDPLGVVFQLQGDFELYVNGKMTYSYGQDDLRRIQHCVMLGNRPGNQKIELLIRTRKRGENSLKIFGGQDTYDPQIMIAGKEIIDRASGFYEGLSNCILGLYAMMAFCSLVLFLCKRSEKYLLFAAINALIRMTLNLFISGSDMFPVSRSLYYSLRAVLFILPVMLNVAMCTAFYQQNMPVKIRKVFSLKAKAMVALGCILLQQSTGIILYHLLRRLMWIPMVMILTYAWEEKASEAAALLISYAVCEGIGLYFNAINMYGFAPSIWSMYMNQTITGSAVFMVTWMAIVFWRFGNGFKLSQQLSVKLRSINEQLEETVCARTESLVRERNRQREMMLNMFHDLRSPIFAIRGTLDMLREDPQGIEEYIQIIDGKSAYMEKLCNDLFLLAKLESDRYMITRECMNLSKLCKEFGEQQKTILKAKGYELILEIEENVDILGDKLSITRVLQNLVENACNHSQTGKRIWLTCGKDEYDAYISVIDEGKGIAPEDLPHVFDRYFAQDKRKDATGLGLAISRELIKLHMGEIRVKSTRGKGTEMRMRIPINPDAEIQEQNPS